MLPPIYLDHQATTPLDERVLDAMLPYLRGGFGNPASTQHALGRQAEGAVEHARRQVATLVGAQPGEIVFCSGATEANNLAIAGAAKLTNRRRLVTSATEHLAVLEPMSMLAMQGWDVVVLGVDRDGRIDLAELLGVVDDDTALVSIAAANNEIGTVNDLRPIADIAHRCGALLHADAAQAVGKMPMDVVARGVDLLSLSAHKLYGPKGIGALVVRAPLAPIVHGGGQERGLRSGTVNVAGCIGLGAACEISAIEMESEAERLRGLAHHVLGRLVRGAAAELNGPIERLPGNLNARLPGVEADALMARCPRVAISAGSACSSATSSPSHVLRAIGLDDTEAEESIRIGLGRMTTRQDVDDACDLLIQVATDIRRVVAHG
jgi:cysteine desulfurase